MSDGKRSPAEDSAALARQCAKMLRRAFGIRSVRTAMVLGTGWGDALTLKHEQSVAIAELPGFEGLADLPGHARRVVYGTLRDKPVIALRGRVHMNEWFSTPRAPHMVRLQIEMLVALGVRDLVLTAAVGSLDDRIAVGDIVLPNGLMTLLAPPLPLHTGEFCSPDDELNRGLRDVAREAAKAAKLVVRAGAHAMVCGPFFESRSIDKRILAERFVASVVGMSILPEIAVFGAVSRVKERRALAVTFVTNTASEEHSHETNQARARESAGKLGKLLSGIIKDL